LYTVVRIGVLGRGNHKEVDGKTVGRGKKVRHSTGSYWKFFRKKTALRKKIVYPQGGSQRKRENWNWSEKKCQSASNSGGNERREDHLYQKRQN